MSEKGESPRCIGKRRPRFAVVKLGEETDIAGLFTLLLEHGYPQVNFVVDMKEACECTKSVNGGSGDEVNGGERTPSLSNGVAQKKHLLKPVLLRTNGTTRTPVTPLVTIPHLRDSPNSSRASSLCREDSVPVSVVKRPRLSPVLLQRHSPPLGQPVQLGLSGQPSTSGVIPSHISSTSSVTIQKHPIEPVIGERVKCQACNVELFGTPRVRHIQFMNHIYIHCPTYRWGCSLCDFACAQLYGIRQHITNPSGVHNGKTAEIVDKCNGSVVEEWCALAKELFPSNSERLIAGIRQMVTFRDWKKKREDERMRESDG